MIRLEHVSFRYATSPTLRLDDVTLGIDEGELSLVLGPTGGGKTTLLGCLNNLVPRFTGGIRHGRIHLAGRETTHALPRELATTIGYVGQDPSASFVTDTVEEELAYSMEQLGFPGPEMRRRVEETLDLMGISDLRGRALRKLSGGQQQRVAIGAVLASSPGILVLDEPTSALDPLAAEEVLAILARLVSDLGTTVVLAEHRMERVVEFADSAILVTSDGRVSHGATREIMRTSPIRPPLVELADRRDWHPLPLSIRDSRRHAAAQRRRWAESPPHLPEAHAPGATALTARGVLVRYPQVVAVRNVDLDLHEGEVVALMGRNGSGKSTLLWALHGAGQRDSGTVSVTGGGSVSLVPQTASDLLYLSSVAEECADADAAADVSSGTTRELLARLSPGVTSDAHPRDLSEGQKLALVLAIELAAAPRILLLDEPTRGLDYTAKRHLGTLLRQLAADGHAVVVATHDVELVADTCSRVVVMAEGEVVSDGPTREVLPGSALLATQVAKIANPIPVMTVEEYTDAAG